MKKYFLFTLFYCAALAGCLPADACKTPVPPCGKTEMAKPRWPFFAYCIGTHDEKKRTLIQQATMLKELGYDGCGHLWLDRVAERSVTLSDAGLRLFQVYVMADLAKEQPVEEDRIAKILPSLKEHGTQLALLIRGGEPSDSKMDERVVTVAGRLADMGRPYGVKVVLYPHAGFWLETCGDAVRVAKKANRPEEIGVMFNLCHWMKADPQRDLRTVIQEAMPWLMAVSINGSDAPEQVRSGEGDWLQPLDQGTYDVRELLNILRDEGYSGPVGLQCWGIRGDAKDHLSRSMAAWQGLTANREESGSAMIANGADWKDTDGNPISCHDGAIMRVADTFYWYGSSYKGNPKGLWGRRGSKLQNGFNVYSSRNLADWKYEGVCFEFPASGWLSGGTSHRPNVLFNDKTEKYVMWFYCIGNDEPEYPGAMLAVATADLPTGPFTFLGRRRTGQEHGWGADLGLFKDDDGKAYLIYDDGLRNIRVDLLSEDYLSSTKRSVVALEPKCEGSAMIKYKGKYIVAGSGVHGWNATETVYAVASAPLGPYSEKKIMSKQKTWGSQISNFFYVKESDMVIALCDQWWGGWEGRVDLDRSRYLFLPIVFDPENFTATMIFKRNWSPL